MAPIPETCCSPAGSVYDAFCCCWISGGFTVLMAVYRGGDALLFERATCSVFDNTFQPDAFVLVVDGPILSGLAATIAQLEIEFPLNVCVFQRIQPLASSSW